MQPIFNNRLLRRLQRHHSVSVIFRSVDPSMPPASIPGPAIEASPLSALPVVQARILPGKDASLPVAPPMRSVAAPVATAPVQTAAVMPAFLPPTPYNMPAPPAPIRTPTPAPAATVSEAPSAEMDDRTWRRLQAIIKKHEEQDKEQGQQQENPPIEEKPAPAAANPPEPSRVAAPLKRGVAELPQPGSAVEIPRRDAEMAEETEFPALQAQQTEQDMHITQLPSVEPELSPIASENTRWEVSIAPGQPSPLEERGATRLDAMTGFSHSEVKPEAPTEIETHPVHLPDRAIREEENLTERIPRPGVSAIIAKEQPALPVDLKSPVPARLDTTPPVIPASIPGRPEKAPTAASESVPARPVLNSTSEVPLPLQDVWPVERIEAQAPAAAFSRPMPPIPLSAEVPEVSPELEKIIKGIKPGQPTDSHVEVITPRQPRPVVPSAVPSTAKPPAVQKKPLPETEIPSSVGEQKTNTIFTEIGNLPADLWTLIGEKPPAEPVEVSKISAPMDKAPATVEIASAAISEAEKTSRTARPRPVPLPAAQLDVLAATEEVVPHPAPELSISICGSDQPC